MVNNPIYESSSDESFTSIDDDDNSIKLKERIPETNLFNNIAEFPELQTFEDDKDHEKLAIFDDFINLNTKEMKKIHEYLTAGRKFGFTIFCFGQNLEVCQKR